MKPLFSFDPPLPVIYRDVTVRIVHTADHGLSTYELVDEDGVVIQSGEVVRERAQDQPSVQVTDD